MAGVQFTLTTGPTTLPITLAATTVAGGQVVEFDGATGVRPAGAGSATVAGVAVTDGAVAGTDALTGAGATANPRPAVVTVVRGPYRVPVTYAAAATYRALLKTAANGQVTPYVVGTDPVSQIVGRCDEIAGVGAAAVGNMTLLVT